MVTKKLLIIATSEAQLPKTGDPTGLWLEELAAPYLAFKEAGYEVDVVSIKGGKIPLDPHSVQEGSTLLADSKQFLEDPTLKKIIEETPSFKGVNVDDYDGVYLPGAFDEECAALVAKFWAADKVVSAVCHGSGGLTAVKTSGGEPIVKGKKVAGFSNTEEEEVGYTDKVPYSLESKLRELGGIYSKGENWSSYGVTDGKLVTG